MSKSNGQSWVKYGIWIIEGMDMPPFLDSMPDTDFWRFFAAHLPVGTKQPDSWPRAVKMCQIFHRLALQYATVWRVL